MIAAPVDLQDELRAARGALDAFAGRLSEDPHEAARLVQLVIAAATASGAPGLAADELRPWLFGLMRAAFHSVERRRFLDRTRRVPDRPWNTAQVAIYALTPQEPLMTAPSRYAVREDDWGSTVFDIWTGRAVILDDTPQTGMKLKDAYALAEMLSHGAAGGERGVLQ